MNYKKSLKHLRRDMRDDWFYDTLGYEDLLEAVDSLQDVIAENLEINHGEYGVGRRGVYDIPKKTLGLRYTLEIDFYDRFLYQSICTYLIPYFDPLLSNRVLSNRFNKFGKEKYLFKNNIEMWKNYENITYLALKEGKCLLTTDLLSYFEQISVDVVEKAFVGMISNLACTGAEKYRIRSAITTLKLVLEKWCYNSTQGLPQNRDASSFVANVVLSSVDKTMEEKGYDYFRYVDDIRIICDDERQAKRALNDLIYELRELGLSTNSKKTAILHYDSEDLSEFFPGKDDRMTLIDTMWRSRSKKVITRSIPVLIDFIDELIEKDKTQERTFRFCINRAKTLVATNIFDSNSILASRLADSLIAELSKQPVSTDQFCSILMDLELTAGHLTKIEEFLTDEKIAIFGWQNYHLYLLLAAKKYKSDTLIQFSRKLINEGFYRPEVSACLIYLAVVGALGELEELIEKYDQDIWPYQHQRYFMLALQESTSEKLQALYPKIGFRVRGTTKRLGQSKIYVKSPLYFWKNKSTSLHNIYDELSQYD